MRLNVGDKIYCFVDGINDLTKGKSYKVTNIRGKSRWSGDDICILDDKGSNWWFGQIGNSECWTMWFVSEKEWLRNKKLEKLGV